MFSIFTVTMQGKIFYHAVWGTFYFASKGQNSSYELSTKKFGFYFFSKYEIYITFHITELYQKVKN